MILKFSGSTAPTRAKADTRPSRTFGAPQTTWCVSSLDIERQPALNNAQNLAHNQKPTVDQAKPFDVAVFTALGQAHARDIPAPAEEIFIRDGAREFSALPRSHNAAMGVTPNAGAVIPVQQGELTRHIVSVDGASLLGVESGDPASDEAISVKPRLTFGSEVGRMAPTTAPKAPITISEFGAAPMAAERLAIEQNFNAPAIELGAISTAISAAERAPIQFAPPTMPAPAGAAWAQVISAISERNGEAKLELRLNPPELGRVIIGFESAGGELVRAVVSADSQQTLDLMRRNLDILQRELARSGLDHIDVELADRDSRSHSHDADEQILAYAASDDAAAYTENNLPLAPFIADGRLDLRV